MASWLAASDVNIWWLNGRARLIFNLIYSKCYPQPFWQQDWQNQAWWVSQETFGSNKWYSWWMRGNSCLTSSKPLPSSISPALQTHESPSFPESTLLSLWTRPQGWRLRSSMLFGLGPQVHIYIGLGGPVGNPNTLERHPDLQRHLSIYIFTHTNSCLYKKDLYIHLMNLFQATSP